MNTRTIGFILLGAFLSLVVGTFILPTELNIERAVLVNAKPVDLYSSISDLSKWNDWEPWGTGTTSEHTTGVGASRGWPGGGEMILSELEKDAVHYQVHGLAMPASGFLALQEVEGGTEVVGSASGSAAAAAGLNVEAEGVFIDVGVGAVRCRPWTRRQDEFF